MALFLLYLLELSVALLLLRQGQVVGLQLGGEAGYSRLEDCQLVVVFQQCVNGVNQTVLGLEYSVQILKIFIQLILVKFSLYSFLI